MARKYLLDPNETVRVVIFVDTRNGLVVHQTKEVYENAVGSTPPVMFEEDQELPEGVYKEYADFARPSFSLQQEIEQETISYTGTGDDTRVKVNAVKQSEMKIKYLLRNWSLSDEEPTLKLVTVKDSHNRKHLTPDCLKTVMNNVQPALVSGFMTALNWWDSKRMKESEDDTKQEVEAATGIKAPN